MKLTGIRLSKYSDHDTLDQCSYFHHDFHNGAYSASETINHGFESHINLSVF